MHPTAIRSSFSVLACTLVVAACGGGGGGGTTVAVTQPVAQVAATQALINNRVYDGTFSNGNTHQTFVFDDKIYTLYGLAFNGQLSVIGLLQGDAVLGNGTVTSPNLKDFSVSGAVQSATLSASYTPGTSFNGSVTEGSNTFTFTGAPSVTSLYNYSSAASLGDLGGAWSVKDMQGTSVDLTIDANGLVTGSTPAVAPATTGCAFTGQVVPSATGKNLFDLTLTYGAAPCKLAGTSVTGIALEYQFTNGKHQLILFGTDAARQNAVTYLGMR
ncbi:MAG: hypothetical protein ACRYGK_11660 [Janthinobacterium lividum]